MATPMASTVPETGHLIAPVKTDGVEPQHGNGSALGKKIAVTELLSHLGREPAELRVERGSGSEGAVEAQLGMLDSDTDLGLAILGLDVEAQGGEKRHGLPKGSRTEKRDPLREAKVMPGRLVRFAFEHEISLEWFDYGVRIVESDAGERKSTESGRVPGMSEGQTASGQTRL